MFRRLKIRVFRPLASPQFSGHRCVNESNLSAGSKSRDIGRNCLRSQLGQGLNPERKMWMLSEECPTISQPGSDTDSFRMARTGSTFVDTPGVGCERVKAGENGLAEEIPLTRTIY